MPPSWSTINGSSWMFWELMILITVILGGGMRVTSAHLHSSHLAS